MISSSAASSVVGASATPAAPAIILTRAVSNGEEHTDAATDCSKHAVKRMGVKRSAGAAGPNTEAAS
eukprot:scaffold57305_cov50-Phaeocystis_antarctica.AAC.3